MNNFRCLVVTCLFFFCFSFHGIGQMLCDSQSEDWHPHVRGMQLPRAFEISYRANVDYHIRSHSDSLGPGNGEIKKDRFFQAKVRFPLWNGDRFKMAGSFAYSDEEFEFDDVSKHSYPLYKSLDEKNLKSIGGSIYAIGHLKKNSYFMVRLSGKLNGDYWKKGIGDVSQNTFLKYELTPLVGWKVNPYKSWGVGVSYSYSFGEPFLFPVISYNQTFDEKWGIEAFLPARLKLRYHPLKLTYINALAKVSGGSYSIHMDAPALSDFKTMELRRSEIDFSLNIEQGLQDWMWMEFSAGYWVNLKFDVTHNNHHFTLSGREALNRNYAIDSSVDPGFFFQLSLFIAPSKRLIQAFGF